MSLSTAKAFDAFYERINPTPADKKTANARIDQTSATLHRAFGAGASTPLIDVHPMGSVARGTAIRPMDDIDVLAVFKNKDGVFEKYRNDAQAFLYLIRTKFNEATSVQQVGARGQAVRLFYADNLWVDIAPAFNRTGGGFLLPAGDGTWLSSDPLKQSEWVKANLKATSDTQRRSVQFLKAWNKAHSRRIGSWHLEVMALTILTEKNNDRRGCLDDFFQDAHLYLNVDDPDGHGGNLARSLATTQRQAILQSFASAKSRARAALMAEWEEDHHEAKRLWRIILGSGFPVD